MKHVSDLTIKRQSVSVSNLRGIMRNRKNTNELLLDPYFEYKDFIESCRNKQYSEDTITHRHHIIPKSLGGSDSKENIVKLSLEDHVTAHRLLAKCFDDKSYEKSVNLSAINLLNRGPKTKEDIEAHRELYFGENNPFYGKKHSVETKQKISIATKERRTCVDYESLYGLEKESIEKEKRSLGVKRYHERLTSTERKTRGANISNSLKNLNLKAHNRIPVIIDGVLYDSITDASVKLNISIYFVRKKLNEN